MSRPLDDSNRVSRRRFAIAAATIASLATAGCFDSEERADGGPTDRPSDVGSESETETQTDAFEPRLSTTATVVRQATADEPPLLEFHLTNDGPTDVDVEPTDDGGLPLEYLGSTGDLAFVPTDPEHVSLEGGDGEFDSDDECWRLPADANLVYDDMPFRASIRRGGTYEITHEVYDDGDDADCFAFETVELSHGIAVYERGSTEDPAYASLSYDIASEGDELRVERSRPSSE